MIPAWCCNFYKHEFFIAKKNSFVLFVELCKRHFCDKIITFIAKLKRRKVTCDAFLGFLIVNSVFKFFKTCVTQVEGGGV